MKSVAFTLALFLLSAIPTAAITIEKIHFDIDLGAEKENISISLFSDKRIDYVSFSLPVEPQNLFVSEDYEIAGNEVIVKRIIENESFEFFIFFQSPELTTKINDKEYLFTFTYSAPSAVKDFLLKTALPAEAIISEKGGLLVSRPVSIFTDGRRIFLEWSKPLAEGEQFSAFVQYKIKTEQNQTLLSLLLALFLFAGLIVGYKIKKFRKMKFIEQTISEDERKIVDELMKGEVLQEELREKTNFSKTKISKLVRSLEQKGIIKKTPYKKTNKLKIK